MLKPVIHHWTSMIRHVYKHCHPSMLRSCCNLMFHMYFLASLTSCYIPCSSFILHTFYIVNMSKSSQNIMDSDLLMFFLPPRTAWKIRSKSSCTMVMTGTWWRCMWRGERSFLAEVVTRDLELKIIVFNRAGYLKISVIVAFLAVEGGSHWWLI